MLENFGSFDSSSYLSKIFLHFII